MQISIPLNLWKGILWTVVMLQEQYSASVCIIYSPYQKSFTFASCILYSWFCRFLKISIISICTQHAYVSSKYLQLFIRNMPNTYLNLIHIQYDLKIMQILGTFYYRYIYLSYLSSKQINSQICYNIFWLNKKLNHIKKK